MIDAHARSKEYGTAGQPSAVGVQVNNLYTQRRIKYYAITESEAVVLASENVNASVYFSLASFLVGIAISIWVNALFYTTVNASGELARSYVAPVLLLVGVVSLFMGIAARRRGSSLWSEIKTASEEAQNHSSV